MTAAPRIGVLAHGDFGAERPAGLRDYYRRWVGTVEGAGLDGIYLPTEIGWDRVSPLTLFGAFAAWSERVEVGTCVLLAPLYSPVALAEAATTAQAVSGGRAVLGIGMGWRRAEFDAAEVDLRSRLPRLRDHLGVLGDLLAGHSVSHRGAAFSLDGVRTGIAADLPPVPVWLGAHGPAGIARAARAADAWVAGPFTTLRQLTRQVGLYRAERERAGREVGRLPVMRELVVAETEAEAWRTAALIQDKYREYAQRVGAVPFDADGPLRELAAERFVVGDPGRCAEHLARIARDTGATDLILRMQYRGDDPEAALRRVRLLGEDVLPLLGKAIEADGPDREVGQP